MDVPTYQQLLAEMYHESAPNLLVHHNEYDDEDVGPDDKYPDELDHQEEFQQPHGSRQAVEIQQNIPQYIDKTKFSVTYEKDVQTRVINIDSRFRHQPNDIIATEESILQLPHTSTDFIYKLTTPIKNIVSVRLSSIEIPNTYYTFSLTRGNTTMRIYYPPGQTTTYNDFTIDDGNYIVDLVTNTLPNNLTYAVQTKLNTNTLGLSLQITFNLITSKITIAETTNKQFDIDFKLGRFGGRVNDWGLGYNIGFRKKMYTGFYTYTGEAIVDALDNNYLFLHLDPDWKVIKHSNQQTTELSAFAKILVSVPKNTVIYDNGSNTLTKEYWFDKPQTIRSIRIRLTDTYEQPIDLVGMEMSFTLELKEVMNTSLYNYYVDQQQPIREV